MLAGFTQTKGTSQGFLFDTETLEPFFETEAAAKALEAMKEARKYNSPPDDYVFFMYALVSIPYLLTRHLFMSGRCALMLNWGNALTAGNSTFIRDKIGAAKVVP